LSGRPEDEEEKEEESAEEERAIGEPAREEVLVLEEGSISLSFCWCVLWRLCKVRTPKTRAIAMATKVLRLGTSERRNWKRSSCMVMVPT
jgi:hypothetical protein